MKNSYMLRLLAMLIAGLVATARPNAQINPVNPDRNNHSDNRVPSTTRQPATEAPLEYCIPYSDCGYGDFINSVYLNMMTNEGSLCSENGYGDFTGLYAELNAGEGYWIGVEAGNGNQFLSLWIDYNDNDQFDGDELIIVDFYLELPYEVYWEWFIVPADVSAGNHRMRLRINAGMSSADPCADFTNGETEDYTVQVVVNQPAYCIPYANCMDGDGFDSFILGDIVNLSSGCSDQGYGDFTTMSTSLVQGEIYSLGVVSNYPDQWVTMWIDFDDSWTFDENELLISDFYVEFSAQEFWNDFFIPADASTGTHRLRARATYSVAMTDPCLDADWGETEDYMVEIISGSAFSDVGLVSIDIPDVVPEGNVDVLVSIENYGETTETFILSIICEISGTSQWVNDLLPGETRQINFGLWNMPAGQYEFYSYFDVPGDINPDNNQLTKSVYVQKSVLAIGFTPASMQGAPDGGLVFFDLSTPDNFQLIAPSNLDNFLTSACWYNDAIYAGKAGGGFYTTDQYGGTTLVASTSEEITGLESDGNTMYATTVSLIAKNIYQSKFWEINPNTGSMTLITVMDQTVGEMMGLACNSLGELFGFDITNDNFYAIDKTTGATTLIGNLGLDLTGYQDLSYDPATESFYLAGYTNKGALYKINPETEEVLYLGDFQNEARVSAFAIPDEILMPTPQNLTAEATNNIVSLNWDDVLYWFFDGYKIYRDGQQIATTQNPAFVDICLEPGNHDYTVTSYYADVESEPTQPVVATTQNCAVALVNDGFESFLPGQQLVQQAQAMNIGYWDTWSHAPGGPEDPYVTSSAALSGQNSLLVELNNDVAMSLGNRTTGKYACSFSIYVEPGKCGFFFIMNDIDQLLYTLEALMVSDGTGWIMAGHSEWISFTHVSGEWNEVLLTFDLDNDLMKCFINGSEIIETPLSHAFGGVITPVKLGALDFWGGDYSGMNPKFYVDDINYYELLEIPFPPQNPQISETGGEVLLTWEAPMEGIINYQIFRNDQFLGATVDTEFLDSGLEPGNYSYDIGAIYEGCEAFTETPLLISLPAVQQLAVPQGWSGISSYLFPNDPLLENIFAPLAGQLIILKNLNGTYVPGQGSNTLINWETGSGYAVKVTDNVSLEIQGIFPQTNELVLPAGWSIIPVLSECAVNVETVFGSAEVVIVKEVAGYKLYWPVAGVNTLNELLPGRAYYIYLNSQTSFVFPACE
ncbi:MAG TPA: GEVED domain-containing protein [Bacteroidales bacterium]|nr:GEVED domain-containing protein [Bacteroidales bacterium]